MSLKSAQFALETALARLALWALRRMSPVGASNLGGALARAIGPLTPVSLVADANLRMAMPELDPAGRRRVIRGVWDNLGRTIAELPHVGTLKQNDAGPGWELRGGEMLGPLAAHPGPVLFFSGHIGNWELLPVAACSFGIRMSSFYRAADNKQVDRMIADLRSDAVGGGVPQFAKGAAGARAALAFLKDGGRLGMLVDQKMNDGIPAMFFGRMAMTAPAAAAYALRFRCPVVPSVVERLGPARFRVICEPALDLPDSGDRIADIAAVTTTMNGYLERWIRSRPESWLWLHRRWPKESL